MTIIRYVIWVGCSVINEKNVNKTFQSLKRYSVQTQAIIKLSPVFLQSLNWLARNIWPQKVVIQMCWASYGGTFVMIYIYLTRPSVSRSSNSLWIYLRIFFCQFEEIFGRRQVLLHFWKLSNNKINNASFVAFEGSSRSKRDKTNWNTQKIRKRK